MKESIGEPDPISRAEYIGHEGRIPRLEEWRFSHDKEHDKHVATQAWVYRVGYTVAAVIASAAASIVAALVRAFTGRQFCRERGMVRA